MAGTGRWLVSKGISARDFASVLACMLVIAITLIVINVFSELLTVLFIQPKESDAAQQRLEFIPKSGIPSPLAQTCTGVRQNSMAMAGLMFIYYRNGSAGLITGPVTIPLIKTQ